LPVTELTTGILNLDLFRKLKNKAYLINVARGEHLNEDDLLKAIDQDIISGEQA
jgi:glyoxylate/hydroxypyruvate reductase A